MVALVLVLGWSLVASAAGTSGGTTHQESSSVEPSGTWWGGASDQDTDWDEPSWPSERPVGAPGRVDTFTAPSVGLRPATLERLRAGREVELIVEYVAPNLPANADDTTIRRGQRLTKADVLHEMQVFDIEEVQDYSHLPLNVLRVRSLQALEALRHDPRVKAVHEVGVKSLQLNQSLPLIEQPTAYGLGATGSGTTVAVLDTGVDYTRSAFGSCTAPGGSCKVVYALDFPTDDGSRDDDGHGTNVAGIVLGVAPQARIAALDVFGAGGTALDSDILAALNWSIANRATYNIVAVNLSLGGDQKYTAPCSGSSYEAAFSSLRSAGIFIAVASGNEGYTDGLSSPACVPGAVSVGAVYDSNVGGITWSGCTDTVTSADKVTCFSNSASFISLLAPGALIEAAGLEQGGTSQASPHVAGAAAALKSLCSPATPNDILSALQVSGKSVTDWRNGITKPRIDVAAAAQRLTSTLNCSGGGTAKPDLIVTTVSSPTTGTAGGSITAASTVSNQGTAAAGAFRLGYYLSADGSITINDVDTTWGCDVSSLAPGATFTCSGTVGIPATLTTGSYYLGAYADNKGEVSEGNEGNNGLAASNPIAITGTGGGQPSAEDYYRKVNAYFLGVLGRTATDAELAQWGAVLRDNKGSVWRPTGAGLQTYLSGLMGWGTAPLDRATASSRVDEVFINLFGSSSDLDPRILDYYIEALVSGSVRERGLVNAILNDLAIMPKVDGTYGQPTGWTGGAAIRDLLTAEQFAQYRARVEDF
ncbi:S8 family peptidase [Thermochromatium tepidum]|nr:S8 family serine peptidase [Thermochromatium tepidum]